MTYVDTVLAAVNVALRAGLALCMIFCIIRFAPRMNLGERLGAGITGGGAIMTMPIIIDMYKQGTPFDGWATSIITLGVIIGFSGLMHRLKLHELRNAEARKQAEAHLAGKGKV